VLGNSIATWRIIGAVFALGLFAGCGEVPPSERVDGKTLKFWRAQLDDYNATSKVEALGALARFDDPPVELIAGYLDHKTRSVCVGAAQALGAAGPTALAYANRLALLMEKAPEGLDARSAKKLRDAAMAALGSMGAGAFEHFSHLLVSDSATLRARAVFALRPFVKGLKDGVNTVLPLMKDEHVVVRREATKSLGAAAEATNDRRASQALMLALDDLDSAVSMAAAIAIGSLGGSSDVEGKALSELLYAHRQGVRASAAYALGLMGEEASPYLRQVTDLLKNDNRAMVRIQAARAHFRISGGPDAALPQLEKEMQASDAGLCRDAIKAIGEMGPAAAPALDSLVPFLERSGLEAVAAQALGAMGPAAKAALPQLAKAAEAAGAEGPTREEIDRARRAIAGE